MDLRKTFGVLVGLTLVGRVSFALDLADCGESITNRQHPAPTTVDITPPDFHRTAPDPGEKNCCPPAEWSTCNPKSVKVDLMDHITVTGTNAQGCRAGFDDPIACHSEWCAKFFNYVKDPGGTDKDEDSGQDYPWSVPCGNKNSTKGFEYYSKTTETEAFHYRGWCEIAGVRREHEDDCSREKVVKHERVKAGSGHMDPCQNDPECQNP